MQQVVDLKKLNRFILMLSLIKVPMLGLCRPRVLELNENQARVLLPFEFLTKNHVGSMYFGVLAMGSELSVALRLLDRIQREKVPVSFIFKDYSCEFLKRAEEPVIFATDEVKAIDSLIDQALSSPDRFNGTFQGYALGQKSGEKLMAYKVTISMKRFDRKEKSRHRSL